MASTCSTNDGSAMGLNPCHERDPREDHNFFCAADERAAGSASSSIVHYGPLETWMHDRVSTYAKIWGSICADGIIAENGGLTFQSPDVQWPSNTTKLYERDVYKSITDDLLKNQYSCVYIAGTSGVGKAFYLLYLMYKLVTESKAKGSAVPTIFYKTRDGESVLLQPNGNVMRSPMAVPVFTIHTGVPSYVLIDSVDHAVDLQYGPHSLVASSTKYFKEFQKRTIEVKGKGKKIYMDQRSKEELQCIFSHPQDVLDLRYDVFGCNVRNFTLEATPDTALSNNPHYAVVQSVMKLFFGARKHSDSVSDEQWSRTKASITSAIVERLITVEESAHTQSQEAFRSMFYQTQATTGQQTWATSFFKVLAGKILYTRAKVTLSERLQQIIGTSSAMDIVFEYQGHEALLKSSCMYTAKGLAKHQRSISFRVPNTLEIFRAIVDIGALRAGCYGVPSAGNFPCINSVMQPDTLFQFTTTCEHPGIEMTMVTIRAQLREKKLSKHRLVFVVPKELLGKFSAQSGYGDIKQFMMTYSTFHAGGEPMAIVC